MARMACRFASTMCRRSRFSSKEAPLRDPSSRRRFTPGVCENSDSRPPQDAAVGGSGIRLRSRIRGRRAGDSCARRCCRRVWRGSGVSVVGMLLVVLCECSEAENVSAVAVRAISDLESSKFQRHRPHWSWCCRSLLFQQVWHGSSCWYCRPDARRARIRAHGAILTAV